MLASILTSGAAGVAAWILFGSYYGGGVASPILALACVIVFGGLYTVSQWILYGYVKGRRVDIFETKIRHISAGWALYSFLFVVGAVFFIVPGLYVLARLAPYLPRVARGDDVFAGITATWQDTESYEEPILVQGSVYCLAGLIVAALVGLLPVYAATGVSGLTGLIVQSSVGFVSFSLAFVIAALTVNSFLVATARETGLLDAPRAV
jgi:hypothetical protein